MESVRVFFLCNGGAADGPRSRSLSLTHTHTLAAVGRSRAGSIDAMVENKARGMRARGLRVSGGPALPPAPLSMESDALAAWAWGGVGGGRVPFFGERVKENKHIAPSFVSPSLQKAMTVPPPDLVLPPVAAQVRCPRRASWPGVGMRSDRCNTQRICPHPLHPLSPLFQLVIAGLDVVGAG